MNLEQVKNKNYCATVINLPNVRYELNGLDNLEGVSILGYNVIVSKGSSGLGVLFTAETQLSDEFCYENNLYREDSRTGNLNKDKSSKGYLEKNRRIKAIKFKGNTSNALFMPINSLGYTCANIEMLKEGDEFDVLNGKEICRKYEIEKKSQNQKNSVDRGFIRTDKLYFPEHIDTDNFFKYHNKILPETEVVITQKLHGTSIRIGNTLVNRKLTLIEKIAKFFSAKIQDTEYANLYGSRKVIKDANNPNQNHYYESDIWTNEGKKLDHVIPENYVLYGELIGWTPDGKPIQKNYTYGIDKGMCELYIYRITIVNPRGLTTDLSWKQIKEFCKNNGIKHVPEIGVTQLVALTEDDCAYAKSLLDVKYFEKGFRNCIWLGENDLVDEGICIRAEGLQPKILKAKSPKFLEHESKMLDTGEEDLESSQNINE